MIGRYFEQKPLLLDWLKGDINEAVFHFVDFIIELDNRNYEIKETGGEPLTKALIHWLKSDKTKQYFIKGMECIYCENKCNDIVIQLNIEASYTLYTFFLEGNK